MSQDIVGGLIREDFFWKIVKMKDVFDNQKTNGLDIDKYALYSGIVQSI